MTRILQPRSKIQLIVGSFILIAFVFCGTLLSRVLVVVNAFKQENGHTVNTQRSETTFYNKLPTPILIETNILGDDLSSGVLNPIKQLSKINLSCKYSLEDVFPIYDVHQHLIGTARPSSANHEGTVIIDRDCIGDLPTKLISISNLLPYSIIVDIAYSPFYFPQESKFIDVPAHGYLQVNGKHLTKSIYPVYDANHLPIGAIRYKNGHPPQHGNTVHIEITSSCLGKEPSFYQ